MNDYSYSEIQNMQKRAMERVREMQRNSDSVLLHARTELESEPKREQTGFSRTPPAPTPIQSPVRPKVTNMPANFPKERRQEEQNLPERAEIREKDGGLLESVLNEPDRAMLLGLLLLLKSEGADEALMMALMYIMS
ncbi:MAG: hypothetical protein J1F23_07225 [Oscillospiraceae bacterium]|nr:hypothetical protein [Oscillospiraceae bacterium]